MTYVLDPRYFVAVQIKHIKFCQVLKIPYLFNLVLAKHQHTKRWDRVKL